MRNRRIANRFLVTIIIIIAIKTEHKKRPFNGKGGRFEMGTVLIMMVQEKEGEGGREEESVKLEKERKGGK